MTKKELDSMERRLVEMSETFVKTHDETLQFAYQVLYLRWVEGLKGREESVTQREPLGHVIT